MISTKVIRLWMDNGEVDMNFKCIAGNRLREVAQCRRFPATSIRSSPEQILDHKFFRRIGKIIRKTPGIVRHFLGTPVSNVVMGTRVIQMQIKSTVDQIVDHIRDAIFNGKYLPGDRLKETEIAKWLSVSRTPVRDSLHKLEAEGLAEFQPNKGFIVPLIGDHDIDEICELRTLIELYCIRKFIRIASEKHLEEMECIINQMKDSLSNDDIPNYFSLSLDFHAYYIRHCQNERIFVCFKSIRSTMRMAQAILGKNKSFYKQSLNEHLEIMRLIKERSPKCEKALRLHISEACSRMRALMQ